MVRTIAFLLALVLIAGTATVATAAAYGNPVVANAELGEFRHGTYPSIGKRTHVGFDLAAKRMTPADVSKAERLAREWLEKHPR